MLLVIAASCVRYDGALTPVDPDLDVLLRNTEQWPGASTIMARADDPEGVYVIVPDASGPNPAPCIRVAATTGRQTATMLMLGPGSASRTPLPTHDVRAIVYGLHFPRPAFHLFAIGGPSRPGFHSEDSATGRIDFVFERNGRTRRLLTERAFNSSRVPELRDAVSVDPAGHWIAWLRGGGDGTWRLAVWRVN